MEHDLRRFGFAFVKELHEHVDDELHGRVVVVVQDDLVASRLAGRRLLDDPYVAFFLVLLVGSTSWHVKRPPETLYTVLPDVEPPGRRGSLDERRAFVLWPGKRHGFPRFRASPW